MNIKNILSEIKDQYLEDDRDPDTGKLRPWIVAFSGGKDSTMLLQLVWVAIHSLSKEHRRRKIYVICNNTLVENPKIIDYVERVLDKVEVAAKKQRMPVEVQRTTPALEDSFWVNLIGKGYPAPNRVFRWCTERLKISPTTRFIVDKIKNNGRVILLLGTRKAESENRKRSMEKHEVKGERLSKHQLPNAYVYSPIKDVSTDEVWIYLTQVPSPWGASNRELINIYKGANEGDCPLVMDKMTPACGSSRFGCWVCTVVSKDKSMAGLVANGETWMEPLLEFRDFLADSREDTSAREKTRRNGSTNAMGPYKPPFRAEILKRLLTVQKEIHLTEPTLRLIHYQELEAIQVLWNRDDIFDQEVPAIYADVYNKPLLISDEKRSRIQREQRTLKRVCSDEPGYYELLNQLHELQRSKGVLMNKREIRDAIESHIERFLDKS
ncbi:MAG: DNA phosphorothioation system sulfurtransferase DndC [Cytophagales bacterium]|nr:DNA phosphorothioation system sulfurtransferase DndC [Cytophagales bacterium]